LAAFRGLDKKPYDFQKYAAGSKHYGSGRLNPTSGPVDPLGYRERDAEVRNKRNALLRRMKAQQAKKYMSSDWLRGSQ
jgi:hypothetical protein